VIEKGTGDSSVSESSSTSESGAESSDETISEGTIRARAREKQQKKEEVQVSDAPTCLKQKSSQVRGTEEGKYLRNFIYAS
jgi:hypothetical protein